MRRDISTPVRRTIVRLPTGLAGLTAVAIHPLVAFPFLVIEAPSPFSILVTQPRSNLIAGAIDESAIFRMGRTLSAVRFPPVTVGRVNQHSNATAIPRGD